jgi:uncharacterized protein (DUF2267 family)
MAGWHAGPDLGPEPTDDARRGLRDDPGPPTRLVSLGPPSGLAATSAPREEGGEEMSATGLEAFDKTLQITHTWLDEIMVELGPDRQVAYHALRAVLHALRDRLPLNLAAHLGAQLPLLVRGIYYDSWHPQPETSRERSREEFLEHVAAGLQNVRPINPEQAVRVVFATIGRHVTEGQVEKIRQALPKDVQALWPDDIVGPR